jgi:hypothetical protein
VQGQDAWLKRPGGKWYFLSGLLFEMSCLCAVTAFEISTTGRECTRGATLTWNGALADGVIKLPLFDIQAA